MITAFNLLSRWVYVGVTFTLHWIYTGGYNGSNIEILLKHLTELSPQCVLIRLEDREKSEPVTWTLNWQHNYSDMWWEQPTWNNTGCYQEYPKSSLFHVHTTVASVSLWLNSQCALGFCLLLPPAPPPDWTQWRVQLQDRLCKEVPSGLHVLCGKPSSPPHSLTQRPFSNLSPHLASLFLSPTPNTDLPSERSRSCSSLCPAEAWRG